MTDPCDDAPDAYDHLLDPEQAVVVPPNPDVAITVEVDVSPSMLTSLINRARTEGRPVEDLVADALRAAAA
jgi:hypothetical protein